MTAAFLFAASLSRPTLLALAIMSHIRAATLLSNQQRPNFAQIKKLKPSNFVEKASRNIIFRRIKVLTGVIQAFS
jgi:hypothetical protein